MTKTKRKPGFEGSHIIKTGPFAIGCISPEARDCLDRIMEEWAKRKKGLPKQIGGKRYRPGVYSFAYWLIRWSGLVQPKVAPK